MKRFFSFIFCSLLFISVFSHFAYAETIDTFKSTIEILKNGVIRVEETITYDFGYANKHGIYRTIPTIRKNKEGKKYKLEYRILSVSDESGVPYTYTQTGGETIKLKIGSANKTVSGMKTYVITYEVSGALTYFSDHDELYWNVTGNEWEVPMRNATVTVRVPGDIAKENVKLACFTGPPGSTEQHCSLDYINGLVTGSAEESLSAGSGFTIVIGFPKSIVALLEAKEYVSFWETAGGKILSTIFMVLMFLWYFGLPIAIPVLWLIYGRDPKARGPVRAWYDPPQTKTGRPLTPCETGSLIDEKAEMRDVFAAIVDLARRGFFKIVEKKKGDFYFVGSTQSTAELLPYERTLLDGIFHGGAGEVRIKDKKLATTVEKVKDMIYESLTKDQFFPHNPQTIRTVYMILGGVAFFTFNIPLAIELFLFGNVMPKKTLYGAEQANVAKSLKNFLVSQDRQLEFQAKNQMFFEKLLPFAVAFGVEKIWADRFKSFDLRQPDWYEGYDNHVFSTAYFMSSMTSSFSSFQRSATPVTSSTGHSSGFSGGGFSGGGGGGGGGGSW